jgi:hypothetical protein
MKNKWEILYNPFTKIAGWKAFAVGAIIVCATVCIGYCNNAYLTGISMKVKIDLHLSLWQCFLIQATGLLSMILLMYLVSLFFTRHVRLQDIAGTVLLSRIPYLFIALFLLYVNPVMQPFLEKLQENVSLEALTDMFSIFAYIILMLFAVFVLLILAWYIALLYHAFKVSTGIKGRKTGILLTGIIILSEIITFIVMQSFIL